MKSSGSNHQAFFYLSSRQRGDHCGSINHNDGLRTELMAECLGKRPAFLMQDRQWSPSLSTNSPQRHSVLSKILALVWRALAIWSSSRFPTLAIGKASDQAAVWLFCAVSRLEWFQGLGVLSRTASESLQARSSQADFVSFCRGDESWSVDQTSVAFITSPWGNVREGSNLLTRLWQAKDDDRKHGRDRSAAERKPRPPCLIGRDACDQLSFPKVTLLIFPCLFLLRCRTPQVPLCICSMGHNATNMWG